MTLPIQVGPSTITVNRAGRGAADLRFHDGEVDVLANTAGFEILHEVPPRPAPWEG